MAELSEQQFKALLTEVVRADVSASPPITDRRGLAGFEKSLRNIAVRLRSGDPIRLAKNSATEWEDVKKWVWGVGNLHVVRKEDYTNGFHLKGLLEMVASPETKFEQKYRELADHIINKFASQNWGVPKEVEKKSASNTKHKKRKAEESEEEEIPAAKKTKCAQVDKSKLKRAPKDHPIYGESGIMRGILWYRAKNGSQTCLDEKYPVKNARVFGHNGLDVGAWFPRQMAAMRDGAHGEKIAGIAGDPDEGAWSIVVNKGGYGGVDKDEGNVITYSAPGAYETKAKTVDAEARRAKCLMKSLETKQPVRVLRGQTSWKGAPFSGYRYDGLYVVEEKGEGKNKKGGVYMWFKLVRILDQEPINKKVPNKVQRDQEEKVSQGY